MDSFDLDVAHSEGYIAGEKGAIRSANPYPADHFLHSAWNDGWDEAWEEYETERVLPTSFGVEHGIVVLVLLVFLVMIIGKILYWLGYY